MIEYGKAPVVIGTFYPHQPEMMFYLYLPVVFPDREGIFMPARLLPYLSLFRAACNDFASAFGVEEAKSRYVYVTAKTLHVTPDAPGNRPGWHVDGFGSGGDINYIWSDKNPTEFAVQSFSNISEDDRQSMLDMEAQVVASHIRTYRENTLLRLNEGVVHRVSPCVEGGIRRFVKISFSRHRFNNEGNSINYLTEYEWEMQKRGEGRNLDSK